MRLAVLGVIAGQLSGCSVLALMSEPPAPRRGETRSCRSAELPLADATAGGVFAVSALAHPDILTIYYLAPASVLLLTSSLVGAVLRCRDIDARTAAKLEEESARDRAARKAERLQEAWELTKRAATAARADDCTTVRSLAVEVRRLSPSFHDEVFLADVAIQRCLDAPDTEGR
jgi:hypothetical protein